MPEDDAPLSPLEKLKALRQIESALHRSKLPTLRGCGLSEEIAVKVANEELIEVYLAGEDDAATLDKYRVNKISEAGLGILALGDVAEPEPLKISVVHPHKSVWRRIGEAMGNKLLALIMNALSAAMGALIGWYMKKHFP